MSTSDSKQVDNNLVEQAKELLNQLENGNLCRRHADYFQPAFKA